MRAFIVNPDNTSQFLQVEREAPVPVGRELLVQVHAVSLNPVDTKVRGRTRRARSGWDAAGVVRAVGPEARFFRPGDPVYYAGDITRDGCNAELHTVDERIVGRKPQRLDFKQAAAIPLTALTAWEDSMSSSSSARATTAVPSWYSTPPVGGFARRAAAKRLSHMKVIGTASREESIAWTRKQTPITSSTIAATCRPSSRPLAWTTSITSTAATTPRRTSRRWRQ